MQKYYFLFIQKSKLHLAAKKYIFNWKSIKKFNRRFLKLDYKFESFILIKKIRRFD